jgi:hypothetical protein
VLAAALVCFFVITLDAVIVNRLLQVPGSADGCPRQHTTNVSPPPAASW